MNLCRSLSSSIRSLGSFLAIAIALPATSACNEYAYARRAAIDDAYRSTREAIEDRREIRRVPERCSRSRTGRCGFALEPAIVAGGLRAYLCSEAGDCDDAKLNELSTRMREWYPASFTRQTIPNTDAVRLQAFERRFREQHNAAVDKALDADLQAADESRAAALSKEEASTRNASSGVSGGDIARVAVASLAAGVVGASRGAAGIPEPAAPVAHTSRALTAPGEALLLFGGAEHNIFLGCLNCGEYDESSVWNKYSQYGFGNTYAIWNRYGEHLNPYSATSVCNSYATDGPLVTDARGSARARFTLNEYAAGSVCAAIGDAAMCNVARRLCAPR